jgi:hypothetical protein
LFADLLLRDATEIVQEGQVTDPGLDALRVQLPFADLQDLERDRGLNQISDLFTVDLLSSYITWKLGGRGEAERTIQAPARHHTLEDLTLSVN